MRRPHAVGAAPPADLVFGLVERGEDGQRLRRRQEGELTEPFDLARLTGANRRGSGGGVGPLQRDIHDTVLQELLCLSLGLNNLQGRPMDVSTKREVAHLQAVASQTYERLRDLLGNGESAPGVEKLAPPRKMADVLSKCVRSFNRKSGARVEFEVREGTGAPMVSGEVARQAELIVHEALCNAWRHGQAQSIKVVLAETADIVWVKVLDDGRGFDSSVRKAGHFGLRIVQERADAIGARLGISSAPGKGTCVNLYVPRDRSTLSITQEVSNGYSFAGRR